MENFEFENTTPPVQICDELWKKIQRVQIILVVRRWKPVPVYCSGLVVLSSRRMQFAMLFVSLIRDVVLFSVKGPFGIEKKILSFKGGLTGQISSQFVFHVHYLIFARRLLEPVDAQPCLNKFYRPSVSWLASHISKSFDSTSIHQYQAIGTCKSGTSGFLN